MAHGHRRLVPNWHTETTMPPQVTLQESLRSISIEDLRARLVSRTCEPRQGVNN
jgi:hypothetical protein